LRKNPELQCAEKKELWHSSEEENKKREEEREKVSLRYDCSLNGSSRIGSYIAAISVKKRGGADAHDGRTRWGKEKKGLFFVIPR